MAVHLGRYRVLAHLASGGMADVVLGRSDGIEGFERHVVLKLIRPEFARDERFIRMFVDEARVAASLHHQHIVQVHDVGEVDGEYFIAMEYVHGEDLRRLLANAAKQRVDVPVSHVLSIVSAAAAGLHYAHERCGPDKQPLNIVHRDVSPSNILVGYDGSVKVVDFGIATASMRQDTRSGGLKGKLSYVSPEQCRGIAVDRRSDVYGLGAVLYELLTTSRMIKGSSDYAVMEQVVHGRIQPPQLRRPDLPPELVAIVMRAVATDRERRYATADQLRMELDDFASASGLTATTSMIATYMRSQFGSRPEPWLGLDDQASADFEPISSSRLRELRGDVDRPSVSSIPRQSGPLAVFETGVAAGAAPHRPSLTPAPVPRPHSEPPSLGPVWRGVAGWRGVSPRALAAGGAMLVGALGLWLALRSPEPAGGPSAPSAAAPAVAAGPATPPASPPPPPLPTASPPPTAVEPAASPAPAVTAAPPRGPAVRVAPADPVPVRKRHIAVAARTAPREVESPVASKPEAAPPPAVIAGSSPAAEPASATRGLPPLPAPPPIPAPGEPASLAGAAADRPPAATSAPQVVSPTALDALRIAGDRTIAPDESTMDAISRSGRDKLIVAVKLCVGADGSVGTVNPLGGSGFPAYDAKIVSTIRREWRYRPFVVDGKPTPVCTALRFVYAQ